MQLTRFKALDGWRGIAALMVALYHVPILTPMQSLPNWKAMELCVDFFFVLSGFVIMHSWGARLVDFSSVPSFMKKRFWRIWPLHIAILAGFVAIEVLRLFVWVFVAKMGDQAPFTNNFSVATLISNIVLTQSLGLHGMTSWNGPAWSISVEFWTYLVFALVMVFSTLRMSALVLIAGVSMAVILFFAPILLFSTHDYGMFRALYGFFTGAILYEVAAKAPSRMDFGLAGELGILVFAGVFLATTTISPRIMAAPLVFAGLILVFSRSTGPITRLLETPALAALGLWSYSIYLVHTLLFHVTRLGLYLIERVTKTSLTAGGEGGSRVFSFGMPLLDAFAVILLLGATVAVSSITYRHIERRFLNGI